MDSEAGPIRTRPDNVISSSPSIGSEAHSHEYWEDPCCIPDMVFATFEDASAHH